MSVRFLRTAALLAAIVTFAGCGGGGGDGDNGSAYEEPAGKPQETLTIRGGNLFFDPDEVELPAGVNAIDLAGEGGLHTLVFEDEKVPGFKLEVQGDGDSDELKLRVRPGEYSFYCDVPGHREGGMEGTLTVT